MKRKMPKMKKKIATPKMRYSAVKNLSKEQLRQLDEAFDILFEETFKRLLTGRWSEHK